MTDNELSRNREKVIWCSGDVSGVCCLSKKLTTDKKYICDSCKRRAKNEKYKVIKSSDINVFELRVNKYIKKGWRAVGEMQYLVIEKDINRATFKPMHLVKEHTYIQAIIRD